MRTTIARDDGLLEKFAHWQCITGDLARYEPLR